MERTEMRMEKMERVERVEKDKRIADMRSVYAEMDEDKRQKMELLAINLLNVQKVVDSGRTIPKHNQGIIYR